VATVAGVCQFFPMPRKKTKRTGAASETLTPVDAGVTPGDEITVAIIEDNRLVREGLTALLGRVRDIRVVTAGSSADMAVLERVHPRVILLDLGLKTSDSLLVAKRLVTAFPASGVIVMDMLHVHEEIMEFVNLGVAGFIMKDASVDDLSKTIRRVAAGGRVLPPQLTGTLFAQIAKTAVSGRQSEVADAVRMTPRERQVIALISEGLSNKAIAGRLHIAPHTVKSHVRNIMEKLALHTRLQIAAHAHRDPEG
jgi:DNA-binding NarL/FixJ family response regulator